MTLDDKIALAQRVADAIQAVFGQVFAASDIAAQIQPPKESKLGDLAYPCFQLAKQLKKAPPMIAGELAAALAPTIGSDGRFSKVEAAGPYLNAFLNKARRFGELLPRILDGSWLAPRANAQRERVMIEYSQPNTHKVFHVGHTRNVSLGDSLVRLTRFAGHDVVASNYIGDVGTHIAKCLWNFTTQYRGEVPEKNRGAFLGQMYSDADALLDLSTLTRAPHPGVISARVLSIEKHPSEAKWQVVVVDHGSGQAQVICGGQGFQVGDVVAYAKIGTRLGKRRIEIADKGGVRSEGMICGEAEISLGGDNQKIFVFPAGTPLGIEIAELLRIDGALDSSFSVLATWNARNEGVRKILKSLEEGEPSITKLWQETRQWSLDEFDAIYRWLDSPFDHFFYESDVGDEGKAIVLDALERGVLIKSEGAIGADLTPAKLPFFMLLKSDGTGLYSTKDLALAKRKFEDFKIDRSVYVVDASQSLHFEQVFATLRKLGYAQAEKCFHLAYGMVMLPDGKMSSRKGNVIPFAELKDQLVAYIRREYLDKQLGDMSEDEITETARCVVIATIKYGMLNQDNNKVIVFDLEQWTAPKGNTGPYLMYAFARTRSILRELGSYSAAQADYSLLTHDAEGELLSTMARFEKVALDAAAAYQPQLLCIYLYDLSRDLSRFYESCSVLKAESEGLKIARAALVDAAGRVIQKGLELLGIRTVDRM